MLIYISNTDKEGRTDSGNSEQQSPNS